MIIFFVLPFLLLQAVTVTVNAEASSYGVISVFFIPLGTGSVAFFAVYVVLVLRRVFLGDQNIMAVFKVALPSSGICSARRAVAVTSRRSVHPENLRLEFCTSDESLNYKLPTFGDLLSQIKSLCLKSKTVGLSRFPT
jgi:hypothetical protein